MACKVSNSSWLHKTLLLLTSLVGCAIILEFTCRLLNVDFEARLAAHEAWPIFYRWPRTPVGEVFFRRSGPAVWQGNVLSRALELAGALDRAYIDEPEAIITYDEQGFRNPPDLTDWDMVVVGDSFVELGYLSDNDLFSTILGKLLNVRVKNLGVSYTGPFTYNFYLQKYGNSFSAKHAIMVFFEGNDLRDSYKEFLSLQNFKETGKRTYREISRQTSFSIAVIKLIHNVFDKNNKTYTGFIHVPVPQKKIFHNAFYVAHDNNIPITLHYTPPSRSEVSQAEQNSLELALATWAETADQLGMAAWLVYMPVKRRVLNGHLRFMERTEQKFIDWSPSDLPDFVKLICEKHNIRFIDITPALIRETEKGNLTYNTIFDSHLNKYGSMTAAEVIARAMEPWVRR